MPLSVCFESLLLLAVHVPVEDKREFPGFLHAHIYRKTFYKHNQVLFTRSWSARRLSLYSSSCLALRARHSCKSYKQQRITY